jgi:hypothetical protein
MAIMDNYRNQLANPPPKGNRNVHLLGIASNAVRCGISAEQAAHEIGEAWGYSAGEHGEIRHAYQSALKKGARPFETGCPHKPLLPAVRKQRPRIGDGARGFVERRIMQGTSSSWKYSVARTRFISASRRKKVHWTSTSAQRRTGISSRKAESLHRWSWPIR